MSYNTAQPHIASYVILEQDGKIALVLRAHTDWMNNHYGLPSGKVEKEESFTQAAIREAKEEVGVDIKPKDLEVLLTVHRLHEKNDDNRDWVDVIFKADKWQGEPYNAEPKVHSELKWVDPKKLPANTIPVVRYMIEEIEKGHTYAEHGW